MNSNLQPSTDLMRHSARFPCRWLRVAATTLLLVSPLVAQPMSLEDCVARALEHNNQILSADLGVERSRADVTSARANRLPSVNTTLLNYGHSRTGPSVRVQDNPTGAVDPATGDRIFAEETTRIPGVDRDSYGFSAGVSQTLYDGGQGRRNHGAARRALAAAELRLQSSRDEIVFLAKSRYYNLLKAEELVEVQTSAVALSERRLQEAESRLDVGAGTRVDVLRLQVADDNANADLINAVQQVLLAKATLNHVMGRDLSETLQTARLLDDPVSMSPAEDPVQMRARLTDLVALARQRNPEIEALRHGEGAAALNLKAARAAWHPRVAGNLSYSRNNEVFDRVYGGLDENYRLNAGLSVSYNIFDGGLRTAGIRRARVNVETARLALDQEARNIALEVETTYLEMVRLRRILQIARRTAELAAEDLRLAEERYRVGKGRLLEVLDAQVGQTQAASNRVRTRYDLAAAEADMERLVGK